MNVIVTNKYEMLLSSLNIDVIKKITGVFTVDDLVRQFHNFYYNKMILDITSIENYEDINTIQKLSVNFDMSKVILLLDDSPKVNSPLFLSQLVSMSIYNFTKTVDSIPFLIDNPNSYRDVANYHHLNMSNDDFKINEELINNNNTKISQKIIGIKNITDHAGATTFTYLLKKHIEKQYKVRAAEVGRNDFTFFADEGLDSITEYEINNYLSNHVDEDVLLIDMGNNNIEQYCTDVLYLIEPGLIPLNRLISLNSMIFNDLKDKKVILNRSVLSSSDVEDFEKESGAKVFYNMPNIDDKEDNIKSVNELLKILGFTRISEEGSNKVFSLFH